MTQTTSGRDVRNTAPSVEGLGTAADVPIRGVNSGATSIAPTTTAVESMTTPRIEIVDANAMSAKKRASRSSASSPSKNRVWRIAARSVGVAARPSSHSGRIRSSIAGVTGMPRRTVRSVIANPVTNQLDPIARTANDATTSGRASSVTPRATFSAPLTTDHRPPRVTALARTMPASPVTARYPPTSEPSTVVVGSGHSSNAPPTNAAVTGPTTRVTRSIAKTAPGRRWDSRIATTPSSAIPSGTTAPGASRTTRPPAAMAGPAKPAG
jgi:hypothetical protein